MILPKPLPCPWCGHQRSRVATVRPEPRRWEQPTYSGEGLWRRRRCLGCGKSFTTEEHVTGVYPTERAARNNDRNI